MRRGIRVGSPIPGRCDKLIVKVAANERHKGSAGRMHAANRQPPDNVGNLWVIGHEDLKLQLGCGFHGEAGMLLSEPGRLRLAATVDAK
jgi:hypothetical protein